MCCRATKLKQRQNHEKLNLGKSLTLLAGCKYFLVPSSWLAKWRAFINATGKNKSSSAEPENLQAIIDSLICEKVNLPYSFREHQLFPEHLFYTLY